MVVTAAQHRLAFRISSMLTETGRRMNWPKATKMNAQDVIRVLNRAKIHFVVIGTHGITGYRGEERATHDVDILVSKRHHSKAVKAIRRAFPGLEARDLPAVTRFVDPGIGRGVIDLVKPIYRHYQAMFRNVAEVGSYRIPNLEMGLVAKYLAMTSPTRQASKRHTDAGDFSEMVRHCYNQIDRKRLIRLVRLITDRSGDVIMKFVDEAKAGRVLKIDD